MGSLFSSLISASQSFQVYNRQLNVIQSNIANANTPGYAKQTQTLDAMSLNVSGGQAGGVSAGAVVSSRSQFAEQSVRTPLQALGLAEQKAGDLARVEPLFNLTTDSGIEGSINKFFNSFSQLSVSPNDATARQAVMDSAGELATSFNAMASNLANAGHDADTQIQSKVDTINTLGKQIADINAVYRANFDNASDPGLDAKMTSTLEQLSEVADFTLVRGHDGSVSVYLGGQTGIVVGNHQFPISADFSLPQTAIRNSSGEDVTSQFTGGQLTGLLQEKNQLIPSYSGSLNTLAGSLADQVNQQLAAGVDLNGNPPVSDMFTYDPASGSAMSLSVTDITPDQIAAAMPGSPGGNANALNVADLGSAKAVNGYTFTEFLGTIGSQVGTDLATAQADQETQQNLVDQARSMREQVSGVSVDEEAVQLLQVQRAYQASGKLIGVLNNIMDTLMQTLQS